MPPEKYLRAYVPRLGKVIWATALTWKSGAEPIPGDVDKIVFPWGIGDPNDKNSGTMPNVNQLVLLPRRAARSRVGASGRHHTPRRRSVGARNIPAPLSAAAG